MSQPTGPSGEEEQEKEDAALIDSFFLPGGILDPDDEERGEQDMTDVRQTGMSRIPSNPWSSDILQQSQVEGRTLVSTEASDGTIFIHLNPAKPGGCLESPCITTSVPISRPPPAEYTDQAENEVLFGSEDVDQTCVSTKPCDCRKFQDAAISIPGVDSLQDWNAMPKDANSSTPLSRGLIDDPFPGFHDRTIRRPRLDPSNESADMYQVIKRSADLNLGAGEKTTGVHELFQNRNYTSKLIGATKTQANEQGCLKTNPFMASIDPDLDKDSSDTEKSGTHLEPAKEMESTSDLDVQENDEAEDEDVDGSVREDSPFTIRVLTFVHNESTVSSISISSEGDSDQDNSQHSRSECADNRVKNGENMDEVSQGLDSGVVVILGVMDSTRQGTNSEKNGKEELQTKSMNASNYMKIVAEKTTSFQERILEKLSTVSLPDSTIQNNLREIRANAISNLSNWRKTFEEYNAVVKDFTEVIAVLTAATWQTICHVTTSANRALAFLFLFAFQIWKFALVEILEEPMVAICYTIFYFMPSFCSVLLGFFVVPHWTPHFITTITVWSLCSQITAGPIHMGSITIDRIPDLLVNNGGVLPTEKRLKDERACRTILQTLKFVLPVFFLADGFSTEFGTIMGVSGSSRLTTAYMMSLVRKSLVSSPIGWVSWALQVLLATHHPSSSLADLLVLVSGLSSIRLIRYLEVRRSGNKKR